MEETKIFETFRFDFTYRERDSEVLNKLFSKYGYPNLKVDLSSDYDGFWQVLNSRTNQVIWCDYHSGFVTFFKDGKYTKIAFDHKSSKGILNLPNCGYDSFIYFEKSCKVTEPASESEQIIKLNERICALEEELEIYKKRETRILELLKS